VQKIKLKFNLHHQVRHNFHLSDFRETRSLQRHDVDISSKVHLNLSTNMGSVGETCSKLKRKARMSLSQSLGKNHARFTKLINELYLKIFMKIRESV
jgi:hypothetical protein